MAATTETETERPVKKKVDVEECCETLLRLSGAINAWTALFSSQKPDRGEHWTAIDSSSTEIIAVADEIADAGKECVALATGEWGDAFAAEKHAELRHEMERAGSEAVHLRGMAMHRIGWSNTWRTWDSIHCESEARKIFVACRNGLESGYRLKGMSTTDARIALVKAKFVVGKRGSEQKPADARESIDDGNSIDDWFEQLEGFRRVRWGDTEFEPFSPRAAKAVRALYEDRRKGGNGLSPTQMLAAADVSGDNKSGDKVRDIFRLGAKGPDGWFHPAFKSMIVMREADRKYRLVPPSA